MALHASGRRTATARASPVRFTNLKTGLGFILRAAQVFLVLLALFAAALIFNLFRWQDGRTLARAELLFFNRDLCCLLRHVG